MDPLSLLLGYTNRYVNVGTSSGRLFDILAFTARNNIFLSWISDKPPTKFTWHKIAMEYFTPEYLTCLLHSSIGQFLKIWTPYLNFTDLTVALTD